MLDLVGNPEDRFSHNEGQCSMLFSETAGSIKAKFYLKSHWGRGKVALGFGSDRIGTLVSMATDSSHRVIMMKP